MAKQGNIYDIRVVNVDGSDTVFNGVTEVQIVPSTPPLLMLGNSLGVSLAILPLSEGMKVLYENPVPEIELSKATLIM